MEALHIIKAAYDKSIQLSIYQNGKNNNNLHVVSYTDDMVTFLKGRKTFELPIKSNVNLLTGLIIITIYVL